MRAAGLFSGIGGIELGLMRSGHDVVFHCEIDPGAAGVLEARFPGVDLSRDVRELADLPAVDLVAAGFPCQDLSQAGRTAGIRGQKSGVVRHIFRLLDANPTKPRWLLFENVSFMLQLDRGRGMRYLVDELQRRGYRWAYRVVDTRSFGLPQRRQRVVLLASRTDDPRDVLFADDTTPEESVFDSKRWCGFYWTEGLRGLGWAVNAVPTLKGGSTIGIPSAPAIWDPVHGTFSTPDLRDAERLQGFEPEWTQAATEVPGVRRGHRWKLVGNAVSVPVAKWLGDRLANPGNFDEDRLGNTMRANRAWPKAACGAPREKSREVNVSAWPLAVPGPNLADFMSYPLAPLSGRAAAGFKRRLDMSTLRYPPLFGRSLEQYLRAVSMAVA